MDGWLSGTSAAGPASADTASAMALQRAGEIGADTSQVPNLGTSAAIGARTPGAVERFGDAMKRAGSAVTDMSAEDWNRNLQIANTGAQLTRGAIDAVQGPGVQPSPLAPRPQPQPYQKPQPGGQMTLRDLLMALQQGRG